MDPGVAQAIEELRKLTIADLQKRYRQTFGKEAAMFDQTVPVPAHSVAAPGRRRRRPQ